MQALKNAVNALIDNLAATGASDIRIHLIDFDTDAAAGSTFDLRVAGATNMAGVTAAHAFINNPTIYAMAAIRTTRPGCSGRSTGSTAPRRTIRSRPPT